MSSPLLGSKISLISKSEIRYEGILYTVDPEKATIALAKVRSYGTEDRATAEHVPAKSDVYEYIIFKASDIKDLMVRETPQPAPVMYSGLHYDPAIVSVSKPPETQKPAPGGQLFQGVNASEQQSKRNRHPESQTLSEVEVSTLQQVSSQSGTRIETTHLESTVLAQAPGGGRSYRSAKQDGQQSHGGGARRRGQYGMDSEAFQRGKQWTQADVQNRRPGNRGAMGGAGRGQMAGNRQGQNYNVRRFDYYGQPRGAYGGRRSGGAGMNRGGGSVNQFRSVNMYRPKLFYRTDYDFEEANRQFAQQLEDVKEELRKVKVDGEVKEDGSDSMSKGEEESGGGSVEAQIYYDKQKSFFDSISCEANEKADGKVTRPNFKNERELNSQTFGSNSRRGYGGGRQHRNRPQNGANQRGRRPLPRAAHAVENDGW